MAKTTETMEISQALGETRRRDQDLIDRLHKQVPFTWGRRTQFCYKPPKP